MSQTHRVYPAYIKGEVDEVLVIDQQFVEVWAALRCSRTEAINRIWLKGLDAIAEDLGDLGHESKLSSDVYSKWREIRLTLANKQKLEEIYEHLNLDDFRQWCETIGIDSAAFLNEYMVEMPSAKSRSKVIESWLEYMLLDGNEYSVEDIRDAATLQGVVSDDDDWNLMKSVASRKGYSGNAKRGYWRMEKVTS